MHSLDVFRQFERGHWQLSDIDFSAIDRAEVRPEYVTMVKSAVMGESNVIAAVHGFLNEFVDDYDFSTFAVVWGYQEVQHHYAFTSYLEAIDEKVPGERVSAMREPYAPGTTPCATLATNIISELTVNTVYKTVADWVSEPVLRDILLKASLDEAHHAREFIHYTKERLARRPEELPSVLETLYFYTSDNRIKHPVGVFKDGLEELAGHETIDTGFEFFLDKIAGEGGLEDLQDKIRRTFTGITGLELKSNSAVRRALAGALA
jgi:hypothetical protein